MVFLGTVFTVRICCRSHARPRRSNAQLHIQRTQDTIKRTLLVENPSHYLEIAGHEYGEIEFMTELCRRTGCRLLLDVNNVYVSANNLGFDANAYIDAFPGRYVAELHLAGHSADPNLGDALLIDSHDAPVCAAVWQLYARLVERIGPRPRSSNATTTCPHSTSCWLNAIARPFDAGAGEFRMTQSLSAFQEAFAQALQLGAAHDSAWAALAAQPDSRSTETP